MPRLRRLIAAVDRAPALSDGRWSSTTAFSPRALRGEDLPHGKDRAAPRRLRAPSPYRGKKTPALSKSRAPALPFRLQLNARCGGSTCAVRRSRIADRGSRIEDRGSRITDKRTPRSGVSPWRTGMARRHDAPALRRAFADYTANAAEFTRFLPQGSPNSNARSSRATHGRRSAGP